MHVEHERVANGVRTAQDVRWDRAEDQTAGLSTDGVNGEGGGEEIADESGFSLRVFVLTRARADQTCQLTRERFTVLCLVRRTALVSDSSSFSLT